jgi:hypothetical protein
LSGVAAGDWVVTAGTNKAMSGVKLQFDRDAAAPNKEVEVGA